MILDAYPKLDQPMLRKLRLTRAPLTAMSRDATGDTPITCTPEPSGSATTIWQLESPAWHAETHELVLDYEVSMGLPVFLFGPFGLAPANGSVLGMAVQWVNADGSQRGGIPLGELAAEDRRSPWRVRRQITFPRGLLRGTLRLSLVIYLREAGEPLDSERHLARTSGTVFGVLHEDCLLIDGNGSVFPVRQISDEHAPLWRMVCSWDDLTDPVSEENVCLELNMAHPDYPALYNRDGNGWAPLMRDVLASALQLLITKAVMQAEESSIHSGQDLQEGSIGQLIAYMQDVFDLSADKITVSEEPELLAGQLRLALGRNMQE